MEIMRFNNSQSSRPKKLVMAQESQRKPEPLVPDLTDFMNDMFFGTIKTDKKVLMILWAKAKTKRTTWWRRALGGVLAAS